MLCTSLGIFHITPAMGSKQVCQHHKDFICLNCICPGEQCNLTGRVRLEFCPICFQMRKAYSMGYNRQRREGGEGSCSALQKKPECSEYSRASKDQFLMALGHEDDLVHAFTDGS